MLRFTLIDLQPRRQAADLLSLTSELCANSPTTFFSCNIMTADRGMDYPSSVLRFTLADPSGHRCLLFRYGQAAPISGIPCQHAPGVRRKGRYREAGDGSRVHQGGVGPRGSSMSGLEVRAAREVWVALIS